MTPMISDVVLIMENGAYGEDSAVFVSFSGIL
jgi:hypothetical protein